MGLRHKVTEALAASLGRVSAQEEGGERGGGRVSVDGHNNDH